LARRRFEKLPLLDVEIVFIGAQQSHDHPALLKRPR
jgi:hypothetical protein